MIDPQSLALLIQDAFADYHARFADITRRARRRFETMDWTGARADAVERIELYDQCVAECALRLQAALQEHAHDHALWSAVRDGYDRRIASLIDRELYKTFFNTLTRRFFKTRGVDPAIEFVALDIEPTDAITHPVARHSYAVSEQRPTDTFARVLADYGFEIPYAHRTRCAAAIAIRLQDDLAHWGEHPVRAIELLDTVFYRERRAYLIGRVLGEHRFSPCVIALVNDARGLRAEAVLTRRADVAHLFGTSRSYFHADLPTVGDAVVFLRTLLPHKPIDEIYTVLGRAKQGKTERFRTFFHHFASHPGEQLVQAEGTPGMVMAVFTLPSYPLVFKVIRDRFAYPKEMTRKQVEDKYALVFHLDRVGRLLDTQPYRFLRFPRARFSPALLQELLDGCSRSVSEDGDDVIIGLCYVQRRMRPLNLYLREQKFEAAREAALDYGQSIKDMARNNIFPGDMLLKNFGVSRHGRAVFYDYDELCLVTDCHFRNYPTPTCYEEEMSDGPWFYVGPKDVFPERFPQFLGLPPPLARALKAVHGDLFDPQWWRDLQARLNAGDYPDTPPYPEALKLA
ncbi:bifunctional isocitrate dehydrogenase kinase/phosphatase [Pseudoxanthomonas wuyuanensis]|uniref:Isocitrate dehydrogenase kinase/phosphatase n=1 Tax=Pseudoxanthomonas wuyuanensis TaxID=1073196 RepID=A0A286DEJ7_9GAMM|nr:bifunctional isocitrate dehydrogenase kinase/phosphatase [Pseudoxanthomonas wuyuanensis]KAF1715478.1 bifunctional isocitrate dehydrogenase kinase/phosphatase [Pseudoxanthomonas wuyuanensis]SOD57071.1 isocitrate dehydrogenase kinase/phosphatase [Pseudoxanthomonas wuyuanensis]